MRQKIYDFRSRTYAEQKKAIYEEIKAYVLEHTGLKVSNLYIAQVKINVGVDDFKQSFTSTFLFILKKKNLQALV